MTKKLYTVLIMISCFARESMSQVDYWANLVYFGGNPINHIPKGVKIPDRDSKSRSIVNAVISGSSTAELKKQYPDSLEIKVSHLIAGGGLRKKVSHYEVTFPLIVGDKRTELKRIIHSKVRYLLPSIINTIVIPLDSSLKNNPELIFHFLWSRVIDDCWWDIYNKEFSTVQGPPCVAFIVYPLHSFQCGTNFDFTPDDGQIAISWSYNLFSDFYSLPKTISFYNLMMNHSISEQDRKFFVSHNLIDSNGVSNIFTYHEGDSIDSTRSSLKKRYIDLMHGQFDYKKLSKKYNIPPDDLFIVISHEVAYEIFELLEEKKIPIVIPIKRENNPTINFRYLVSIRLAKP